MRTWKHLVAFPSVSWDFNWERQHELIYRLAAITPGEVIIHAPYGLINHSPKAIYQKFQHRKRLENPVFGNPRHPKMQFVSPFFVPVHYNPLTDPINTHRIRNASRVPIADSLIYMTYANGFMRPLLDEAAFSVLDLAQRRQAIPELSQAAKHTERQAVRAAHLVLVDNLATRSDYAADRADIHYLPQGVDLNRFAKGQLLPELAAWRAGFSNVAGYAGSDLALDYPLLLQMVAAHPDTGFLLVGQFDRPEAASLKAFPNVWCTGRIHFEGLPNYYAAMDVGLIPYQLTPRICGVFPTKFFEYLAAGLPVVSVALPDLLPYEGPAVRILKQADSFADKFPLRSHFTADDPRGPLTLARTNTWDQRFTTLLNLLPPCL
jgi:glycosyltransferase involved in cell wall biosynthesis